MLKLSHRVLLASILCLTSVSAFADDQEIVRCVSNEEAFIPEVVVKIKQRGLRSASKYAEIAIRDHQRGVQQTVQNLNHFTMNNFRIVAHMDNGDAIRGERVEATDPNYVVYHATFTVNGQEKEVSCHPQNQNQN